MPATSAWQINPPDTDVCQATEQDGSLLFKGVMLCGGRSMATVVDLICSLLFITVLIYCIGFGVVPIADKYNTQIHNQVLPRHTSHSIPLKDSPHHNTNMVERAVRPCLAGPGIVIIIPHPPFPSTLGVEIC